MSDNSNVVELGAEVNDRMTVEQAIGYIARQSENIQEIVICGFDKGGRFFKVNSDMTKRDTLWIAESLRSFTLDR